MMISEHEVLRGRKRIGQLEAALSDLSIQIDEAADNVHWSILTLSSTLRSIAEKAKEALEEKP